MEIPYEFDNLCNGCHGMRAGNCPLFQKPGQRLYGNPHCCGVLARRGSLGFRRQKVLAEAASHVQQQRLIVSFHLSKQPAKVLPPARVLSVGRGGGREELVKLEQPLRGRREDLLHGRGSHRQSVIKQHGAPFVVAKQGGDELCRIVGRRAHQSFPGFVRPGKAKLAVFEFEVPAVHGNSIQQGHQLARRGVSDQSFSRGLRASRQRKVQTHRPHIRHETPEQGQGLRLLTREDFVGPGFGVEEQRHFLVASREADRARVAVEHVDSKVSQ